MKIIAATATQTFLVEITSTELANLAGYQYELSLEKKIGKQISKSNLENIKGIDDIPVSKIYQDAKDTLDSYKILRTKFESIRNQLKNLTDKMKKLDKGIG